MEPKIVDYPSDGTLEDLSTTCGGDEDGFRAKLTNLKRVHDANGKTAIRATYQRVPLDEKYVSKELFFFDITHASSDEIKNITIEQLKKGRAFAFPDADSAQVYLGGKEAVVAIYREK